MAGRCRGADAPGLPTRKKALARMASRGMSFFSYLLICLVLDDKCWYTLALIDLYTVFCSETIPQFTVEVEP